MRSLIQDDPRELAAFYARQGEVDEAAAIYRKQSAQAAANPKAQVWEVAGPLQSIATLYQGQQRWEDAAATLQQAVGLVEASGGPEARNQAIGMRLNLANVLQQGGQSRAAEQIYESLLSETGSDRNGQQLPVVQAYADQLSITNRAVQGLDLLKDYLANHTLQPQEQANILFSLSRIASGAGRHELADEYQRAAMEKQRAAQPQRPEEGPLIGPDLQKAQAAVNQGNLNEAVDLALRVMASASLARDREQVAWQVPNIAQALASRKAPEEGERLYRQLLALLETWSVDDTSSLTQALQQYSRFLIGQKDRWGEVPAAIDRYREYLVATRGAETSELEQVINLRIDFARAQRRSGGGRTGRGGAAGFRGVAERRDEPTLHARSPNCGKCLSVFRESGTRAQSPPADHRYRGSDSHRERHQRGFARINAAFTLANARQFEEAERLANEAVALGERMRPPQARHVCATGRADPADEDGRGIRVGGPARE